MNTRDLTPWARGALTPEQRSRLAFHPAGGLRLSAVGDARHRNDFTVRLIGPLGTEAEVSSVGKSWLFAAIEQMLRDVGHPLLEETIDA